MKRFGAAWPLPAGMILLVAAFVGAGCNDYGNTFQTNTGAVISTLSPSTISAGGSDFTLTVNGGGFVAKTVVQWNGSTLSSTAVTDTNGNVLYMTATVPAALIAKAGTAFVNTLNPHSGSQDNGLSNTLAFVINPPPNPVPVVSSISPTIAAPGSPTLTLTIAGSDFLPSSDPSGGSVVHWNSGATQFTLPAASITSTQIQATVDLTLLTAQGCAVVSVFNPPSAAGSSGSGLPGNSGGGGGTSANTPTFTISTDPNFCPAPANSMKVSASSSQTVTEETPSVSSDGRYVAYTAMQNGVSQILIRDACTGADSSCQPKTSLLSAAEDGTEGNADSHAPSISADGRYVAFSSAATNLVSSSPAGRQIFLRDTCAGAPSGCTPSTQLISTDDSGQLSGADNILPSISASGRFVAFLSVTYSKYAQPASSSKPQPNSGIRQIFIRDTCLGASGSCTPKTSRISVQPGDTAAISGKPAGPSLSGAASVVGISGTGSATVFTRSVAVDDRVLLAITKSQQ